MVFGSQSSRVATYSVPPWPSLAAPMAAYRRRSFSESEAWNIRIECSISALCVMGGRPWRGRGNPGLGYTVRTQDREVIDSAILDWWHRSCYSWGEDRPEETPDAATECPPPTRTDPRS